MSATSGTWAARAILRRLAVDSSVGQETRMMSAPTSSQRRIWSIVAAASSVGVLVIVCTVIGASPPTGTLPTMLCRLFRRITSRHGLTDAMAADLVMQRGRVNDSVLPVSAAGHHRITSEQGWDSPVADMNNVRLG